MDENDVKLTAAALDATIESLDAAKEILASLRGLMLTPDKTDGKGRGLADVPTERLVRELSGRGGVETHFAGKGAKMALEMDGPAMALTFPNIKAIRG